MTTASFFINVERKMLGKDNIYASNDMPAINKLENDLFGLKSEMEYGVNKIDKKFNEIQEEYKTWHDLAIEEHTALNLQSQINNLGTKDHLKIVQTIEERDNLQNVRTGTICYVEEEGVYYTRKNDEWEIFQSGVGGGGGGVVIGTLTSTLDQKTVSVSVGQPLTVDLFFSTPNVGAGTLHIVSNGVELLNKTITMGTNKVDVNLPKGSHKLEIYVIDRGGVYTNSVIINVHCGGLDISTTFNSDKDYNVGTTITFPYSVNTVSTQPIITYFKIGNNVYQSQSTQGYNRYVFPTLGAGTYKVEVYSKSGDFESNKLTFTLVIMNSGSLYVSSLYDKSEAEEGDQLIIDYRVSMKDVNEFNAIYYVDDKEYKRGKALNGANAFVISSLEKGRRKITIKVATVDGKHEAQTDIYINIVESSYQMKPPVEAGLMAWFDAYGLTNQDLEKGIWRDKSGNNYTGTLHNFNYTTNGWLDNGLKMNGGAYVELNVKPFLHNAEGGLTIDIEFETEDVGDENARVLDCTTTASSNIGCYIDTSQALIKSDKHELKSPFAQNEKTRVTYVIDRTSKLVKVYINAVLCEVAFLGDKGGGNTEVLENFEHDQFIYLNSKKGQDNFGDCTVYSVRVYGRALDSKEVLDNHIADIKDKTLQKKKYDFNYNDTIPTMYFIGDVKEMTKEKAVDLQIKYVSTDEQKYGSSFDLPKCSVKWQGTSSLEYAVKNYKIKLKDAEGQKVKRSLRGDMIPESTFVLKADYMESSHANNTGCAKIVNKYLYSEPLPPQKTNDKVVSAIDGFPIKLYINGESMGVFNFNLDKGNEDSFGFDKNNPECISYEISANTDTTAGAFHKWDETKATDKVTDELTYLKKDFELRFPEEEGKEDYGYLKQLKRLVDWVSDADDKKFREEFDQYLNREYTFKYYLFILAVGMVDNCGKNMMINTWDGKIWFPCFYDLDTCLGLDNSGYLKFDVDIEMEPKTYNTSNSKLWTKVRRVFKDELAEMYRDMRASTFKEENLFNILIGEQIDKIPESLYNEDSERKYIQNPTYLHMLHGSRREHMRKWINERLLYLDSQFGYTMNTRESIIIRANKKGRVELNIKTYSPMFVKVRWRNDDYSTEIKKVGRNETVTFVGDLPTETDQEIAIYGAKHIKDIGDISHMKPTSLSLGNATRLTKLICTDSPNLQAIGGLGGVISTKAANGGLKNLQLIDLTGCSKLGTVASSSGLDVSYCDNLKTLKLHGTALQSVTFNEKGGSLEEMYLPNSLTSLYLNNQHRLKRVEFPSYYRASTLHMREAHDVGSQITNLIINNCPNLVSFGGNYAIATNGILNYRGTIIDAQDKNFDISKEEYIQTLKLGCFGKLGNVNITNSLLNYKYYTINASPSLIRLSLCDMPNLKGIIFTGNRAYGGGGDFNIEKTPMFEEINVSKCNNFDTLIIQKGHNVAYSAYKFKENFEWDLSHLPLKRFICNIALQNLKKIILPDTIEEFSHSNTNTYSYWNTAPDGSSAGYNKEMSPLETIVVKGHYEEGFTGIDLADIPLKNVNFAGLTQQVAIIQNVDCEAIDVVPRMASDHFSGQLISNIHIDLNNYKGPSPFYKIFANADMSQITITLDKPLTAKGMDYSYMLDNAKGVKWEKIKDFLAKLPPGKVYQTFRGCDIDRLEVGRMIGSETTNLQYCFCEMPNVSEISLEGANLSNVTDMTCALYANRNLVKINLEGHRFDKVKTFIRCFQNNPKLEQIIGAENLIQEECADIQGMFHQTPRLRFNFENGKPNWNFKKDKLLPSANFMLECGRDIQLGEHEEYTIDLSECIGSGIRISGSCFITMCGFTKIIAPLVTYDTPMNAVINQSSNIKEIDITNSKITGGLVYAFIRNPKLVKLNMSGVDMSKITTFGRGFQESSNLTDLEFGTGLKCSIVASDAPNLTKKSLMSIIENLGTANAGAVLTLSTASWNLLSDDERNIAARKGWTIARG